MNRFPVPFIVISCLLTSWAAAADAPAENAAAIYQQAFAACPAPDTLAVSLATRGVTDPLDGASLAAVEFFEPAFVLLHKGSAVKRCDWEVDFSKGLDLRLMYLAPARTLSRAVCLQIRYLCAKKQYDKAAEVAANGLILSRRIAGAEVLMARMIGMGMEAIIMSAVEANIPALPPATLQRLSDIAGALPEIPSLPDIVRSEGRMAVTSFRAKMKGNPGGFNADPAGLAAKADEVSAQIKAASDAQAAAMSVPVAQLLAAAEKATRLHDALPQAIGAVIPPPGRIIGNECRINVQRAQFRAALAVARGGVEQLKDFPDPFGTGPFKYEKTADGFSLTSALVQQNESVKLEVGPAALK